MEETLATFIPTEGESKNSIPEELQQILLENDADRQRTTLEIAASHIDVEKQLAPRIYAEWLLRTHGGTSAGGFKGIGFDPWLKKFAAKINRKTAYKLIHAYADKCSLTAPAPRAKNPKPTDPPCVLGNKVEPDPTPDDLELIPAPTSPQDVEDIILRFIREIDDLALHELWQKMNTLFETELSERKKADQEHLDAA